MKANYKKLGILGEGSHATVFLIEDKEGRKFALKKFDIEGNSTEEMKSRFFVEKAVLEKACNVNIISLYDDWVEDGVPCLVVELCEYGSLKSQFHNSGKFSLRKALKAGISILKGLEVMHKNGFIHRDIKPDNILQGEQGFLKLADMGLAKGTGYELSHCPQGTVAYMSPEQYSSYKNVDERSDIYSVGATLYHLYTGRMVYESEDLDDILDSHKNSIVPPLTDKRPDCPLSFNHVVRKMIAKNPADRYQTASEAKEDFEAILDGAESINELPSIMKFKEFANTQIAMDIDITAPEFSTKKRKIAYIFLGFMLFLILIASLVDTGKNKRTDDGNSGGTTDEEAIDDKESSSKKNEATDKQVNTPPDQKKNIKEDTNEQSPPPKKKAYSVTYLGTKLKKFPVKIISVSSNLLECIFEINSNTYSCQLGNNKSNVSVLKLTRKAAIIDYQGKAYHLQTGKDNFIFDGFHHFSVNGQNTAAIPGIKYPKFKLSETTSEVTLSFYTGGKFNFKKNIKPGLKPLTKNDRDKFLKASRGAPVKLQQLKNYYFPFEVKAIKNKYALISSNSGYKRSHIVHDIIDRRFQIKEIHADAVVLKNITTFKIYEISLGKKLVIKQDALVSYKGNSHILSDNSYFFGYRVSIEHGQVNFHSPSNATNKISNKVNAIFLPEIKNSQTVHQNENCKCYNAVLNFDK